MAEIIEIARRALHEQVAYRLRSMLVEGRIPPGAKLNERTLCEQLRVSRTPLREAIKMLSSEGLVDLLPNRGAIAVRLTEADVMNTFEVLAALEGLSGELAARRISADELAEVRAMHDERLACYTRHDTPGYYRINADIHAAINNAAKNRVLAHTYTHMNARVQFLRFRTNQDRSNWKDAVDEHERILRALEAHDAARAAALLFSTTHTERATSSFK